MRFEEITNVKPAIVFYNDSVHRFPDFTQKDIENIKAAVAEQYKSAVERIRKLQMEFPVSFNGYILQNDIVYKVYSANTVIEKITGAEAKEIKRLTKKIIDADKFIRTLPV